MLVELTKGAGSVEAAEKLSSAIATRLRDAVEVVTQLGQYTVVDIIDLDVVVTEGKVLTELRMVIPRLDNDQAVMYDQQVVKITRSNQQIVMARMIKASVFIVARILIGWTIFRVRPRYLEPKMCFRCHGFGHKSGNCSGLDLSLNCRWRDKPGYE